MQNPVGNCCQHVIHTVVTPKKNLHALEREYNFFVENGEMQAKVAGKHFNQHMAAACWQLRWRKIFQCLQKLLCDQQRDVFRKYCDHNKKQNCSCSEHYGDIKQSLSVIWMERVVAHGGALLSEHCLAATLIYIQ